MKGMVTNMKKFLIITIFLLSVIGLSACGKLDVIRDHSVNSYDTVLTLSGDRVLLDEKAENWSLSAPDESAKFLWSMDVSKTLLDVRIETDAKPFLDAGLDPTKLPKGMLQEDKIVVGTDFGDKYVESKKGDSALDAYKNIIFPNRSHLKYHANLDHFGIDLTNGNVFEWAKNTKTNDKDIVFVLDPKEFIDAGVDPNKVKGWVYAKVETMDSKGKKIQVDKFLKPFDLDK